VDVLDIAALIGMAIEGLGGEYFVGGSVASSVHGEPRSTNDLDLVVRLPIGLATPLAERLNASGFEVDTDQLRVALLRASSTNIFYLPSFTKVDLFGVGAEAFDKSEFSRRQQIEVRSGLLLWIKSPEDSILRKLLWYQAGGQVSDHQWRDVQGILRVSAATLDTGYLRLWASRLGLDELLARATVLEG
jgi:hypothetical protein